MLTWRSWGETAFDSVHNAGGEKESPKLCIKRQLFQLLPIQGADSKLGQFLSQDI